MLGDEYGVKIRSREAIEMAAKMISFLPNIS